MERKYKAFISYRHLPLELSVAKKLQRRIERFVIPEQLRKNGEKKLGLAFRDQDELPISSDLNTNIQTALDNAEYLIVICSPETTKSEWVKREISYFLEKHDRDHVLAVLADGTPETAFPPQLTQECAADGTPIHEVEPLAANIAAPSAAKRNALFQTESLRILAALIGCPFDALYRREQRYKRRRTLLAAVAALALAAAFIGMLMDRNAKIREQLRQSQVNESMALAQLAESEYRKGNYRGAVEYALRALPSEDGDRPYVGEAEWRLGQVLHPYRHACMGFDQSFEQDTEVARLALSEDAARVFTADRFGCVRCFDTRGGALLWDKQLGVGGEFYGGIDLTPVAGQDALLYGDRSGGVFGLFEAATGEARWLEENASRVALQPERGLLLCCETEGASDVLTLRRLEDGALLRSVPLPDDFFASELCGALSPDGRFAAVAFDSWSRYGSAVLCVWDTETDELEEIDEYPYDFSTESRAAFTDGALLLAYDAWGEGGETRCYDPARSWEKRWAAQTRSADSYSNLIRGKINMSGSVTVLRGCGDGVLVGGSFAVAKLDAESGEVLWRTTFRDTLIAISALEQGRFCVLLGDGTLSSMSGSGNLGIQGGVKYFSADFPVELCALAGNTFDDTTAAMVSADYPFRVTVVRRQDAPLAEALPGSDALQSYSLWRTSPSGALLAAAEYDPAGKCVVGELWSLREGERLARFSVPSERVLFNGEWLLTEDGVLIGDGYALNAREQSLKYLGRGEYDPTESFLSVRQSAAGRVLSGIVSWDDAENAYFLRVLENDGTLLAETRAFPELDALEFRAEVLTLGEDGSALVAAQPYRGDGPSRYALFRPDGGTWLELPDPEGTVFALAETAPLLAVQQESGTLALYDSETLYPARQIETRLPARSVTKLLFADRDRLLLRFTDACVMEVFDTDSGRLLHRSNFSEYGLSFRENARYDVFVDEAGNRLILIYDYAGYTESVCLVLERENWICVGGYMGVAAYIPGADELLLSPYAAGVYRMPLLDTDGLRRLALDFLSRGSAVPSRP